MISGGGQILLVIFFTPMRFFPVPFRTVIPTTPNLLVEVDHIVPFMFGTNDKDFLVGIFPKGMQGVISIIVLEMDIDTRIVTSL